MNYLGQGKLIGYKTYTKDDKKKHVFNVLNGSVDSNTGLYTDCELITIIQDTQPLPDLKPQNVCFEVNVKNFGGTQQLRYLNLTKC